jgi:FtsZ-interacting cell division protein YlmF
MLDIRQGFVEAREVLDVVGVAEIAQLLGVSKQRVHELLRNDADFPEPAAELAAGRIWQRSEVEHWMAARARHGKETKVEDVDGVPLVTPTSFPEMQVVGDEVRAERAVAIELRQIDVVAMRRCIDFVSGAGYVVGGSVERIADRAYLITPQGVNVSAAQRRALAERLGD